MRVSKWFLVSVFCVSSLASVFHAQAADAPKASAQPTQAIVTVATVNVQDIELIKQENNVFTIAFNISNREGVQPKVIYAVDLIQKDAKKNNIVIDQHIYDNDTLSLGTNASIHKQITYTAPTYLKGEYFIKVEARNTDALIFGMVQIQNAVTLNGTGAYIAIDQPSCFLTVDKEAGNKHYTPEQGVDIASEETLTAHCSLTNTFKTDQTIIPTFQTYYRSVFGKLSKTEKQSALTLKPDQKTDFTATLPKTTEPQAYDAILTFTDANNQVLSSPIDFHYVLRGESATIQNLTVDKDAYRVNDTAVITFFWTGSADGFPGSRLGSTDTGKQVSAMFALVDGQKNACATPVTQTLDAQKRGGVEHFSIPVTADCNNPTISAKIVNQDNKVLAENSYDIASQGTTDATTPVKANAEPKSPNAFVSILAYILAFVFIVVLARYLMKKNTRGRRLSIMFGLMLGAGIFFGGGEARADTFYVNFTTRGGYAAQTIFTASLDKSQYVTRETIRATGTAVSASCTNNPGYEFINFYVNTETAVINGSPATSILNTTTNFTAENTAGSYNALIHATSTNPIENITGSASIKLPYKVVASAPVPTPPTPSKILKICPSKATIAQGSSQRLDLYYDARPAGNCSGAGTTVPATAWSEKATFISLSPSSGTTTTVTAVADSNTIPGGRTATVTATYAGKTATANVTVAAMVPACRCDATLAANTCSTETFTGTIVPPPAKSCQQSLCNGTRDCGSNWKEVPPTN